MEHKDLTETTLATRDIYQGRVVRLQECDVRLPNGRESVREVVRHPGAVAIVAEPRPGELVFVSQYRFATSEVLLELPAGKLEPGEDPLDAATRELEEETGYKTSSLSPVYEFYTSPGFADERISLFYGKGLESGQVNLDEDEFVKVTVHKRAELTELLRNGAIRDAKTIIGVLWWLQFGSAT